MVTECHTKPGNRARDVFRRPDAGHAVDGQVADILIDDTQPVDRIGGKAADDQADERKYTDQGSLYLGTRYGFVAFCRRGPFGAIA